jgi:hypothetical protein
MSETISFGTYAATALWDGKYYIFEPVEVRSDSPAVIVFKPKEIKAGLIVYRGRVIHGVTGSPIAGAIVMRRPEIDLVAPFDDGRFEDYFEQVHHLGPELDPDSALFHFLEQNPALGITRTDGNGWFETALSSARIACLQALAIRGTSWGPSSGCNFCCPASMRAGRVALRISSRTEPEEYPCRT